jgi:hypothetical protein
LNTDNTPAGKVATLFWENMRGFSLNNQRYLSWRKRMQESSILKKALGPVATEVDLGRQEHTVEDVIERLADSIEIEVAEGGANLSDDELEEVDRIRTLIEAEFEKSLALARGPVVYVGPQPVSVH